MVINNFTHKIENKIRPKDTRKMGRGRRVGERQRGEKEKEIEECFGGRRNSL